jgi:hypothetical protein
MTTLINLIGEQPIPNLLSVLYLKPDETKILFSSTTEKVARRIERLIPNCSKHIIEPYNIQEIKSSLDSILEKEKRYIVNITGGTKIMSLALYEAAVARRADFVYLQSEGNQSILFVYSFDQNSKLHHKEILLPELITIDTYLRAHLSEYTFSEDNPHANPSGFEFEKKITNHLTSNGFEVLSNIRPKGEGNQLEIDLVLRLRGTNNVGIAEVKLGDKKEEGPKKGIEQLALASQREYLGTYTQRFLITSRILSPKIKELAIAHKIIIIDEIEETRNGTDLTDDAKRKLITRLKEKLS